MRFRKSISLLIFLSLVCGLCGLKYSLQAKLKGYFSLFNPDKEPLQVSINGESLQKLAFGFDSALASLIWVRLLQEAQHSPVKNNKVSWEFSEVDAVTTLDPHFLTAYQFGAMYVSFFRRDKEGGKRILEKWTRTQPGFWKAHHMLGMHYFSEMGDYKRAASHILQAARLPGAPSYISSLGIGLLTQAGADSYALSTAISLYEAATHPESKMRLARRIRGLRWKLQKSYWQSALNNYLATKNYIKLETLKDLAPFAPPRADRSVSFLDIDKIQSEELTILLREIFEFKVNLQKNLIESTDPKLEKEFQNLGIFFERTD